MEGKKEGGKKEGKRKMERKKECTQEGMKEIKKKSTGKVLDSHKLYHNNKTTDLLQPSHPFLPFHGPNLCYTFSSFAVGCPFVLIP